MSWIFPHAMHWVGSTQLLCASTSSCSMLRFGLLANPLAFLKPLLNEPHSLVLHGLFVARISPPLNYGCLADAMRAASRLSANAGCPSFLTSRCAASRAFADSGPLVLAMQRHHFLSGLGGYEAGPRLHQVTPPL